MAKFLLTPGMDHIFAGGPANLIVADTATLSTGDVILAAPGSNTALLLQNGNQFDLAAPRVLRGITAVLDRSFGNSVITLRDGLDLTLQLGRDNATVHGAANADVIHGGDQGGYATVYLGSARESFIAGSAGATVILTAADAAARIDGRGLTTVTLTGAVGETAKLGGNIEGVGELDITAPGLAVSLRGAGIATVALSASRTALTLGAATHLVTDDAGGNAIQFTTADQTLRLPYAGLNPTLPPDHLTGLRPGDAIDIDLPYGPGETLGYDPRTGALTLTDTRSGAAETVMLTPGAASFALSPDAGLPNGDIGTLVRLLGPHTLPPQAPCFAAGTRVLTPHGWAAVQHLAPGDPLITLSGQLRKLRWIGHRTLACRRHPHPERVLPVHIEAGAFAPDLPLADVVLSPDHALFIEGVLIPVKHLINGATVRQRPVDQVTYYHLELDSHDVLLAEGLPVESYLDTGNRALFANGGAALTLHPDFAAPGTPAPSCAPFVNDGPAVRAARARLLRRADELGYPITHDADLHVLADGQRIWGRLADGVWTGWVPPGTRGLIVASRAAAPADCDPANDDPRRLGVALRGVTVTGGGIGRRLGAGGTGWGDGFYPAEQDAWATWRWSDGRAHLQPALWDGIAGAFKLELHVFRTIAYRAAAACAAQRRIA